MPRDSSGLYTLVTGNPVLKGQPVLASWANPTLDDIASALTDSLDRNGQGAMLAPLVLSGPPTAGLHATTKTYVDARAFPEAPQNGKQHGRQNAAWTEIIHVDAYTKVESDSLYVNVSGDTMTGALTAPSIILPKPASGSTLTGNVSLALTADSLKVQAGTDATQQLLYNLATGELQRTGTPQQVMTYLGSQWKAKRLGGTTGFAVDVDNAQTAELQFLTSGVKRWAFLKDAANEAGANAGSDLTLNRYTDAGALLGTTFAITRSTGKMVYTGNVTVSNVSASTFEVKASSGSAVAALNSVAGGNTASVALQRNGASRWQLEMNGSTESGSNSGSNFQLLRFNDAGTYIGTPIFIARSNGVVQMNEGVYVQNTNAADKVQVLGYGSTTGVGLYLKAAAAGTQIAVQLVNSANSVSGTIYQTDTTIGMANGSDYRLKKDFAFARDALRRVLAVPIYEGKMVGDSQDQIRHYVLAHELQKEVPYAVFGDKDGVEADGITPKMQAVDYGGLTPLLWAAIQELSERIDALEEAMA